MTNQQMELGFGSVRIIRSAVRSRKRLNRAAWWFQRMRETVDQALDWGSKPAPRPEQICFPD